MTESVKFLSFDEQLDRFSELGIVVENRAKASQKLRTIGYYKLKRFAYSVSLRQGSEKPFSGVKFDDLVLRYYQDKNLRIFLLHAIEKIEVSVKVTTSYVLGKKYGAFGYTDFSKWTHIRNFKNQEDRRNSEFKFCKELKEKISRSSLPDFSNPCNLNSKGLPSIWLATDVLTFGDLLYILKKMSNQNINEIARNYNMTKDEFLSWMSCLNFIRNVCAHNSNIIDLRLKTTPLVKDSWKTSLYIYEDGTRYTNRIAIVIFIIKEFISKINPSYIYNNIAHSMNKMVSGSDLKAQSLGYRNFQSFTQTLPIRKRKRKKFHEKK